MRDDLPTSALWLGLSGALPFWAAAVVKLAGLPSLGIDPVHAGIGYGAVILSFLGGIRWGAGLAPVDGRERAIVFSASVLSSLAGFAALLLPAVPALALLIAGFFCQGLWDATSARDGRLPGWFGRLRVLLTGLVVLPLLCLLGDSAGLI